MHRETEVLIVGAGPAGLMCALLLERMGINTLVVERREGPQRAPAAHVVNARSLEICRAAGVDMEALAKAAKSPADAGHVDWVTKLGGRRIGRLPFERQGDDQLEYTPTPLRNLSQNKFEPLLLDALETAPCWNVQWESAEQDGDFVLSKLVDRKTSEPLELRARYLIAADGAGSRIRKSLAIPVLGPDAIQTFVMIHFHAALRPLLGSPPSVLNFVCDPIDGGAFVIHDLDNEATFMLGFDAEKEKLSDYPLSRCEQIVRNALEEPELDIQVETASTWAMTAQVSERYREGRIFLVGDSAHRFPPTGGLGLNTGVQDAHNLAWKMASVLRGHATKALLDTYESERKPIAQNNADQSLKNALQMLQVNQALGTTDNSEAARERMLERLDDAEACAVIAAAIEDQAEHFDMPGLQLGFSYDPEVPPPTPRHFEASGRPGARLPHAWLAGPSSNERSSLLDEVPLDRFILIVGPRGEEWLDAARKVDAERIATFQLSAKQLPTVDAWLEMAGIGESGALLVRPDQHIAWRAESLASASELEAAYLTNSHRST